MNKVIVQLTVSEETDFDGLIHVEDALIQAFLKDRVAEVDGHDIGSDRFNIYIHLSNDWEPTLARVIETLGQLDVLAKVVVAKFHGDTETYEVVHPDPYSRVFAL